MGNNHASTRLEGPPAQLRTALVPMVAPIVARPQSPRSAPASRAGNVRASARAQPPRRITDAGERWLDGSAGRDRDLHFALGRAQARAGRTLDELMGFYRHRRADDVAPADRGGAAPAASSRETSTGSRRPASAASRRLSTQAAEGFAEEQSHRSAPTLATQRARTTAAEGAPSRRGGARRPPPRIGIELVPELALLVGAAEHYDAFVPLGARDHVVLGPREGEFVGALLDPRARCAATRTRGRRRARGAQLALGPTVPLTRVALSLGRARALLALVRGGPAGGAVGRTAARCSAATSTTWSCC